MLMSTASPRHRSVLRYNKGTSTLCIGFSRLQKANNRPNATWNTSQCKPASSFGDVSVSAQQFSVYFPLHVICSFARALSQTLYPRTRTRVHQINSEAALVDEVPALCMLGVPHAIDHNTPYTVNEDVQLVCKYLKAYLVYLEKGGQKGINKVYRESNKLCL